MRRYFLLIAGVLLFLSRSVQSEAEIIPEAIKQNLVYIEATGKQADGTPFGPNAATGVFVHNDGYILTINHILPSDFKEAIIRYSIGEKREPPDRRAEIIDMKPFIDLLLLKGPRAGLIDSPRLGSAWDLARGAPVALHTSGFRPDTPAPVSNLDQTTFVEGPEGYTWLLTSTIESTESGSPVYMDDGTVIGVLKGGPKHTRGSFIPLDVGSSLLSAFKLPEVEKRLSAVESSVNSKLTEGPVSPWFYEQFKKSNKQYASKNKKQIVDEYLSDVVAYSYSSEFTLSKSRKYYELPFYKTNGALGQVDCTARSEGDYFTIYSLLNDLEQEFPCPFLTNDSAKKCPDGDDSSTDDDGAKEPERGGELSSNKDKFTMQEEERARKEDEQRRRRKPVHHSIPIPRSNSEAFKPDSDWLGPFQHVQLFLDDTEMKGEVKVQCAVIVIGPMHSGPPR